MSPAPRSSMDEVIARIRFAADGLVPVVVQDDSSSQVLMVGYMNAEAVRRTLSEGRVTYWSRSRQEFWRKGDSSGNIQILCSAALDCDADTLLLRVQQHGPACHTGAASCFQVDPLPDFRGDVS